MRNYLIVVNPGAGRGDYIHKLEKVCTEIHARHWRYRIVYSHHQAPDRQIQHQLERGEFDELLVIGGDGTLNEALNSLDDRSIPVSVLANGTGNDALKSLLPSSPFSAQLQAAMGDKLRPTDAGQCNGRWFINGVGIGFDGRVVERMVKGHKARKGHWSYLKTVIGILATYRERKATYHLAQQSFEQDIFLMTIANGTTFGGGFKLTPQADIGDGLLDVCIIKAINPLLRFYYLPRLEKGTHIRLPFVEYFKTSEISIGPQPLLVAHMDGEYIGSPPFDIRLIPGAFNFRLPSA